MKLFGSRKEDKGERRKGAFPCVIAENLRTMKEFRGQGSRGTEMDMNRESRGQGSEEQKEVRDSRR